MDRKLITILPAALLGLLVLFTAEIAAVSLLRYFTGLLSAPEPVLANRFANPFLIIHVVAGVLALVVAPLQFVRRIRDARPAIHRANGRIYAAACAIAAPAGFMLALGTFAGPIAASGFAVSAVLWPILTLLGVRAAMLGNFENHRAWMLRSYAICANAITLRLMLPAAMMLGYDFLPSYRVISWLGWLTNLALVEIYLRRRARPGAIEGQLATA